MQKEKVKDLTPESAPPRAWAMGALGWLIPGAGHLLQGHWMRALILGGAVWISFVCGMMMGGHMFTIGADDQGFSALLKIPPMIANLGAGLLYPISWFFGVGFADDPQSAARATYEYGNTFLLIAGLVNYLGMLDAFDISAGRKS